MEHARIIIHVSNVFSSYSSIQYVDKGAGGGSRTYFFQI